MGKPSSGPDTPDPASTSAALNPVPGATTIPDLAKVTEALHDIASDIATTRTHLRVVQEGFERSEAGLRRANRLMQAATPGGANPKSTDARPSGTHVRVNLFGSFHVLIDSNEVVHWNGARARALFAYMASHRQRRIPRAQLLEALWPGADAEAAANSLRVAVHGLRLALRSAIGGESAGQANELLVFENGGYGFNSGVAFSIDTEDFESHWNRARRLEATGDLAGAGIEFEQAEQIYHGDFLEEYISDEWAMLRREGLKDVYLAILSRLAERAFENADYQGCIVRCRELIATDPCREDTYQLLIRAHARLRQPGRARRWYEVCVQVLREELDVEPSAETETAYREIFLRLAK
ncbi:MAG TPA: BTAD domain-containing putative transcriptional regulator [Dehalococcoidia bacterium]|nr:BTAD domain-containing putative transcriptional regulator [Dehalococcoidia bacterium]